MAIFVGKSADKLADTFNNIDETTGAVPVDIISGSTSGTTYADGDSSVGAEGTVVLGKDDTNHLQMLHTGTTGDLQVDVLSSPGIYNHGDTESDPDGQVALGKTSGNNVYAMQVDASGHLQVDVVTGGAGGYQYNDGDTPSPVEGYAMQGVQSGTTIRNLCVDASGHLQVDVLTGGGGGGTQYSEGTSAPTATGNAGLMKRSDNTLHVPLLDASNHQQVDIVADGTLESDGAAAAGAVGRPAMGIDGSSNLQMISVNTDGEVGIHDGGNSITVDDGGNSVTVDGSVTANAGTNLNTSALATESGGNLATIAGGLAAEGAALGSGILVQGDDGTDRHNVAVDTSGHLQVDIISGAGSSTTDMITLQSSTARTADFTTTGVDVRSYKEVYLHIVITAVSGTTPLMILEVETSYDNTNWVHRRTVCEEKVAGDNTTTTGDPDKGKLKAIGTCICLIPNGVGRYLRLNGYITGTSPSFTFSCIGSAV